MTICKPINKKLCRLTLIFVKTSYYRADQSSRTVKLSLKVDFLIMKTPIFIHHMPICKP